MADEFSGRLRERTELERASEARDDSGNALTQWQPQGAIWVALAPVDAPEMVVGAGIVSRPRYRVTLRARADVGLDCRFRWRGKTLRILRIEPDPRAPDQLALIVEEQR
jgi:SPP1 family predicted phage head-tail adaptor